MSNVVSSKYQIVIPKDVRRKVGIKPGQKMRVSTFNDSRLVMEKEPSYRDLIGTLPAQTEDPVKRIRKLRDNWR